MNSDQQIPEPHHEHEHPRSHEHEHAHEHEHPHGPHENDLRGSADAHAHNEHEPHQHDDASHGFGGSGRPLGFWLKVVDRRISEEMETLFADDGLTRRDWRTLNLLAGEANDERLIAKLQAKPGLVDGLADRGWVEGTPPTLTESGREALEQLTERVSALRARIAGTVSPEDFETTIATLEAVARELGWDESQPIPRGHRGGRGFGRRGFGRPSWGERAFGRPGFDPREHVQHGFDPREPFGQPGHEPRHGHGGRDPRQHCGPEAGFDPHAHGRSGRRERFAGHGRPRQDVHVHVHVHEERRGRKHPRPERDA